MCTTSDGAVDAVSCHFAEKWNVAEFGGVRKPQLSRLTDDNFATIGGNFPIVVFVAHNPPTIPGFCLLGKTANNGLDFTVKPEQLKVFLRRVQARLAIFCTCNSLEFAKIIVDCPDVPNCVSAVGVRGKIGFMELTRIVSLVFKGILAAKTCIADPLKTAQEGDASQEKNMLWFHGEDVSQDVLRDS